MPSRPLRCLLAAVLLTLAVASSAVAQPPQRIVQGQAASQGEYPAQGWLRIDGNGDGDFDDNLVDGFCGGTLVGTRQLLTAAHCATDALGPLPPSRFGVRLGNVDRTPAFPDDYLVVANAVHPDYGSDRYGNSHDVAMLTLNRPASAYQPMRVVEKGQERLWRAELSPQPIASTIIGWGATSFGGPDSEFLLENANLVPMRTDADCSADYDEFLGPGTPNAFDSGTMVCAGNGNGDTCQGDSGGPLMVSDGAGGLVMAGVTSFGQGCNDPDFPGVYARIGADPLNTWVRDRTPRAAFNVSGNPQATVPVTLTNASTHPEGAGYFTQFNWDFDRDGQFDDGSGATIQRAFPSPGSVVVGLEASKPGGDRATFYGQFAMGAAPPPPPPPVVVTPPAPRVLARIVANARNKIRNGRFRVRVNFADDAPVGKTATLDVLRGARKLGGAKVRVRPGESVRVAVKLTRAGVRAVRRALTLRVTLRLRLEGAVTQRKTVRLRS